MSTADIHPGRPDRHDIRAYRAIVDRHRLAAIGEIRWIIENSGYLLTRLEKGARPSSFGADARSIASAADQLVSRMAALEALVEVSFLVPDPEAGEP